MSRAASDSVETQEYLKASKLPLFTLRGGGTWHWRKVCPRCGWHTPAFGEVVIASGGICDVVYHRYCLDCGLAVSRSWKSELMRWESEAIWWNPITWARGNWKARILQPKMQNHS